MGWKDFFGKKSEDKAPESFENPTLGDIKVGYMIDYDLKTWEVTAYNYYDWGEGDITEEWQLKAHDDTVYLELESDDEDEWSIGRPIQFASLGGDVRNRLFEKGAPPDEIQYDGITYYLDTVGGGRFYKNGKGSGEEFYIWSYEDEEGEHFLSIEQWDVDEFEAGVAISVEAYQFSNILPRRK